MSHELTIRRDGRVEMAYTGDVPWHGLGTQLPANTPLEGWIAAAGMDWSVEETPVRYLFSGEEIEVTDRRVLHRSDTGAALGIVSSDYHRVQPRETVEFFADLIESLGLQMSTIGTLFNGRKFWATGYIGEEAVVDDKDIVRGYLLLSTSADGSMATTARFTSVRVVCNNTLNMAHGGAAKVRVLHSMKFDPAAAKKTLGLVPKTFGDFMKSIRTLAETPLDTDQAQALLGELLKTDDGPVGTRIMELFAGEALGSGLDGSEGTAWGFLNAVTQFVDHDRKAKSDSHRLNSSLLGSGDRLKSRALELVLAD
jgi:phage/plasmid-like protein (TIGR03299 family)